MTPSGEILPFIMLTHFNDNDPYVSNLKVGSIVKQGQPICEEGTDGATANHLHIVVGNADRGCGNGFIQNSNGKWVSNGYCMKPEEIMYIDKDFTNVLDTNGIIFKDKPKEEPKESFFGSKGYFCLGNYHENIGKICSIANLLPMVYALTVSGFRIETGNAHIRDKRLCAIVHHHLISIRYLGVFTGYCSFNGCR